MKNKKYITPFIEVLKPFERVPLMSKGSGNLDIDDDFTDDPGDGKGTDFEFDDTDTPGPWGTSNKWRSM